MIADGKDGAMVVLCMMSGGLFVFVFEMGVIGGRDAECGMVLIGGGVCLSA